MSSPELLTELGDGSAYSDTESLVWHILRLPKVSSPSPVVKGSSVKLALCPRWGPLPRREGGSRPVREWMMLPLPYQEGEDGVGMES
jgi:hypothetical protein